MMARKERAARIVRYLKKAYPKPRSVSREIVSGARPERVVRLIAKPADPLARRVRKLSELSQGRRRLAPSRARAKSQQRFMRESATSQQRSMRAQKILKYLKSAYPVPKSELVYTTPFQFLVAVVLSAQCTDKAVNKLTATLYKKYKNSRDFAGVQPAKFEKEISSIPFFRNKAKAIIGAAKIVTHQYGGKVPKDVELLQKLPGVGYKTAHVVVGELFDVWPGIPTDTHVKRFARKFDLTTHSDLKKISKDLEALIPKKDWKFVNNGLVLYGRYICKAHKHDCSAHPLTKLWPEAGNRWPKV